MSQLLKLIKQGDRTAPTIYQLGRNERLNIHHNNYANVTDATSGDCIRAMTWSDVRNMGYSPSKLLDGNQVDQLLDKPAKAPRSIKTYINHILGGLAAGMLIAAVSNTTGCTSLVADKIEQDVATSTIAPRTAQNAAQLADFKEQTAYANEKLRAMKLYASAGSAQ